MDELENVAGAEPVADTHSAPVSLDDAMTASMEAAFDKATEAPERDASGRFVSKNPQPEVPEAEASGEPEQGTAEPEPKADVPKVEAVEPPASWTADEKAEFAKLSPETQKAVLRRESERDAAFTRKSQELSEFRKRSEPLDRMLEPMRPALKNAGVSDAQYVQRLIAADQALARNPAEALKQIARGYGLDLTQLATGAEVEDPRYAALEQRLSQVTQFISHQQRAQAEQQLSSTQSEIEAFASEKDSSGNPLREHFDDVFQDMLPIVQGLRAHNPTMAHRAILDKAYRMAVAASETVQAKVKASDEAKRATEAKRAADAARKAATPSFNKGVGSGKAKSRSWDESMNEAYERAGRG